MGKRKKGSVLPWNQRINLFVDSEMLSELKALRTRPTETLGSVCRRLIEENINDRQDPFKDLEDPFKS